MRKNLLDWWKIIAICFAVNLFGFFAKEAMAQNDCAQARAEALSQRGEAIEASQYDFATRMGRLRNLGGGLWDRTIDAQAAIVDCDTSCRLDLFDRILDIQSELRLLASRIDSVEDCLDDIIAKIEEGDEAFDRGEDFKSRGFDGFARNNFIAAKGCYSSAISSTENKIEELDEIADALAAIEQILDMLDDDIDDCCGGIQNLELDEEIEEGDNGNGGGGSGGAGGGIENEELNGM